MATYRQIVQDARKTARKLELLIDLQTENQLQEALGPKGWHLFQQLNDILNPTVRA